MAPCSVMAGRRSVWSFLLFLFLFVCFFSPNHSLWTYDCKTLLHIRAVMADLTRSGKCCFYPRFMPSMPVEPWTGLDCGYRRTRSNRRRKRGRRAETTVKARASWNSDRHRLTSGDMWLERHSCLHPILPASWMPSSRIVVQHQRQVSRGVNWNNLRCCKTAADVQ